MSHTADGDLIHRLLTDTSVVALTSTQRLLPAEGAGTPFFPPSYLGSDNSPTYCISPLADGHNLCVVDSVQSQANRIEAAFLSAPYRALVRPVSVTADMATGEARTLDVLQLGHRAADGALTFSTLQTQARAAIQAWRDGPDELARFSPMSLLFGMWDSRPGGTQVKIPRAISASITARDVDELRRMATFTGSFWTKDLGLEATGTHSEEGIDPVPAAVAKGGVIARGDIARQCTLNLVALRQNCRWQPGPMPGAAARYLAALGVLALSLPPDTFLRQGCLLVAAEPVQWRLVGRDGGQSPLSLDGATALAAAQAAAEAFGIPQLPPLAGTFEKERLLAKGAENKARKASGKAK